MTTTTWTGARAFGGESHVEGGIHWIDYGGPRDAGTIVLVHGLGGSHLNWCRLAPLLNDEAHVVALDLVGFGLSHARGRSSTITANAEVLKAFIDAQGGPVTLIGNSMGGLISGLVASRSPERVERLVLVDPAFPLVLAKPDPLVLASFAAYAVPGVGERVMGRRRSTVSPVDMVRQTLALCCAHPDQIPPDVVATSEALIQERAGEPGLDSAFLEAARSLLRFNASSKRAWQMWHDITAPTLLIHGDKDRLVSINAARAAARRNPGWRFEVLTDVGHVPQLEVPETTASLVLGFLP